MVKGYGGCSGFDGVLVWGVSEKATGAMITV